MKVDKNYFRSELIALAQDSGNQPIIFTGKYKHTDDPKWITFTTIRQYTFDKKTKTVCSHINIREDSISRYLKLTIDNHNRKFYICGRVSTYDHYGDKRACLILAETGTESPLWMTASSKRQNEVMARRILEAARQDPSVDG